MFPLLYKGKRNKLIIDEINGTSAAYSLMKLSSKALVGIRVRRDNDNAETDIGFSGNLLDLVALNSFVGSNSAYIKTWYDQSGNNLNLTQTNTTKQPRIVNAGVFDGGITFDGVNDFLSINTNAAFNIFDNVTINMVLNVLDLSNQAFPAPLAKGTNSAGGLGWAMFSTNATKTLRYKSNNVTLTSSSAISIGTIQNWLMTLNSAQLQWYLNSTADGTLQNLGTYNANGASPFIVGAGEDGNSGWMNCKFYELIIYNPKVLSQTEILKNYIYTKKYYNV